MIETECTLEQGQKVVGLNRVKKGILNNTIKTVYIATDCDGFIDSKISALAKGQVSIIKRYTAKQLGKACKIDVEAAVVGILR
jgi:ribosomal protein L7Ae-like RNA K-turn-binding protein